MASLSVGKAGAGGEATEEGSTYAEIGRHLSLGVNNEAQNGEGETSTGNEQMERRYVGSKDARERVRNWIKQKNEFRLFLVGKVGAGKSTLVNTLLKIDAEEEGAQVGASLSPVTMAVKNYKGRLKSARLPWLKLSIHNVDVQVWDTPGLQDPNEDRARQCLEDIAETWRTNDISLVVYCVNMTQGRSDLGDKSTIQMLTKELGDDIWSRSVFALTHANGVKIPYSANQEDSLESVFETRLQEWDTILKKYLKEANVDSSIADNVPLVPCGYRENPLPVMPNPNWSEIFWEVCLVRMLFESIPAVLSIHPSCVDGSLSDSYTKVIVERLEKPKQEETGFVSSLLEGSTPKDIAQYISDSMVAKMNRRRATTAGLLLLGASAAVVAMGMAK